MIPRLLIIAGGALVMAVILLVVWRSHVPPPDTDDTYVPPPQGVATVIIDSGLAIEGSQVTTLRWIADLDDFVSVNLAAQSYGLGFMLKSKYDEFVERLLEQTTREEANDASSDLAGQLGFRDAGRACIVGFTYSDNLGPGGSTTTTDREVYTIIVCSRG